MRWSLVALVLVVAGAIAFWPRQENRSTAAPAPTPVKTSLPGCLRSSGTGPQAAPQAMAGLTAACLADGGDVDVRQAFAGPALINVWATWCAPCQEELPVLSAYASQPGAVPVVEIAVESEQSTAIAILTDLKVNLPSLLDRDGSVRRALKATVRMPMSYLVDARGNVTLVNDPPVFHTVDDVRKAVGR